jgi:hypothetical protein
MVATPKEAWSAMPYSARIRYQAECLALVARVARSAEEEASAERDEPPAQLSLPLVLDAHAPTDM